MADEEVEEGSGLRSQMWKHELFVEWLHETEGVDLNQEDAATIIAWFAARRNDFRKSDAYLTGVDEHAAERDAEKERRAAARAEAKAAEKAEGDGKAKRASKATAKTAKRATKATKASKATKAPAKKASKASKRASKATAGGGGDSPFD